MRGGQAMGGRGQTRSQPQAHQTTAGRGHEAVGAQARSSTTRAPQPNDSEHHTIPGQTRGTKSTHTAETGYTTPKQAPVSPRATQAHRAMSEVTAEELEASATMSSTPLLDSFYEDGLVTDNVFSILFCGDAASMAIGGVDTSQVSADDTVGLTMVDTQKTYDEIYGYFLVEVSEVSVDDTVVSTDSSDLNEIGGVLVDSGTTLIYLPSSVTSAIETEVESAVSSLDSSFFQWSSCVDESELSNFPDLTLALDGYDLVLSPYQYLLWYSDCYYWGISSSSIPIIGNVALQGKLVVFDKEANQIGFADGDCSAYGGTSFEDDASSKTAEDAVVMPEQGGMTGQVLAAVQGASEHVSGAAVAGGAMVVLGVGFVLARGRGRKSGFAAVPEDEDEFAI